jgi:RNA polymerase sigma factor (sigma-70 family)
MNVRVRQALHELCDASDGDSVSDGELLAAFVRRRDADAFAGLVRRHGPMVLGVCRRVLGDQHDAEDAFQAAFLVLARRATAIVPRDRVGNWLYGVAYRTALEARRMAARRRAAEARLKSVARPNEREAIGSDVSALLDEELSRLPDRLRLPVVLCDLEGRTRRDVAKQLGIPDGTLSNRLAAARGFLAKRLTARGVSLPAATLAIALAEVGPAVPATLFESTIRAALTTSPELTSAAVATLTQHVVKAMYLSKLKVLMAILVMIGGAAGSCLFFGDRALTAGPPGPKQPTPVAPKAPVADSAELKAVLTKAAEEMKAVKATDDDALQKKAGRLVMIAHSQARYGDKSGATVTFGDAITIAGEIKTEDKRAEALVNAGFYQANAGLTDDAMKTVEKIAVKSVSQTNEYRSRVRAEVAAALAKAGKFAAALKVAEAIPDRVFRIKTKNKDEEHRDAMQRDWAYKHIADAQIEAKDPGGAAKTARLVKDDDRRFALMQEVVLGYAKAGDDAGAKKLIDDLRKEIDANPKVGHRRQALAMLQAASGDAAGAKASVEKLDSAEERADGLVEISIGLAYREMWKK